MAYLQVPANDKERVRWLQAAAVQGDAGSMKDLARMLLQGGDGLPADPAKSLQWLRKAAALQHAGATRNRAGYYFKGVDGLEPSASEGLALLKLAADLGDGLGVPRDLPRAVQLLRRSLEVGLETPDPETTALLATPELQQAPRQLDAARGK